MCNDIERAYRRVAGEGVNSLLGGKKGAAWDRYVMTGCAGAGLPPLPCRR
ncbi:MAG: hypothetical protein ACLU1U_00825 [Lachnospiraceae bacterium]